MPKGRSGDDRSQGNLSNVTEVHFDDPADRRIAEEKQQEIKRDTGKEATAPQIIGAVGGHHSHDNDDKREGRNSRSGDRGSGNSGGYSMTGHVDILE
jgi:hypothetical protein